MALAVVIAVGALLRFATLGDQHFWLDEAVTAGLLRLDLGEMLEATVTTESTPPLYYVLARGWAVVFGTEEVGLRSLSALLGTLTIPVVYALGATVASRRAGLVAAALAALSPALVWYSQEARSYALLVLLCALSLLMAARARQEGERRDLAGWALAAGLALATHYFAVFLVAAEVVWILAARPPRRPALVAIAAVGASGLALLPLALDQSEQGNLDFIGSTGLGTRLLDTAQLFLAGPNGERVDVGVAILGAAALLAAALALTAPARERRTALELGAVALAALAAPVLLALAGEDYLLGRNLLPVWPALAVVVAIGIASARRVALGVATGVVLALASAWLVLAVPLDRSLQRETITAALVGRGLDADMDRIDPRVAYGLGDAGVILQARAFCNEGYRVGDQGAQLRHGADQSPVQGSGTEQGVAASARARADGSVLTVYAVCVRPLD